MCRYSFPKDVLFLIIEKLAAAYLASIDTDGVHDFMDEDLWECTDTFFATLSEKGKLPPYNMPLRLWRELSEKT